MNTLYFACPMRKIKITISSETLSELNAFQRFLLVSLYQNNALDEIEQVTFCEQVVWQDELEILCEANLVKEDVDKKRYILSDLGQEYGALLEKFEQLEQNGGVSALLNLHTGQIEIEQDLVNSKNSLPKGTFIFEKKVSDILAQNYDYENSLPFICDLFEIEQTLSNAVRNSLHTQQTWEYKPEIFYKLMILPSNYWDVCIKDSTQFNNTSQLFALEIPMLQKEYRFYFSELDTFRTVLETLSQLFTFDSDLLGNKAAQLLQLSAKEKTFPTQKVVYDCYTGTPHIEDKLRYEPDSETAHPTFTLTRNPIDIPAIRSVRMGYYKEFSHSNFTVTLYLPYQALAEKLEE